VTTQDTQSDRDDARTNIVEDSFASHASSSETGAVQQPESESATPINTEERPSTDEQRSFADYIAAFQLSESFSSTSPAEAFEAPPTVSAPEANTTSDEAQPQEARQSDESVSIIAPSMPAERPVSPLLRPATRIRVPRHGNRHRQDNASKAAPEPEQSGTRAVAGTSENAGEPASTAQHATVQEKQQEQQEGSAPAQVQQEEQRPPRRYRFDRPSLQPAAVQATQPAQAATEAESPKPAAAEQHRTRHQQGQPSEKTHKPQETPALPPAGTPVLTQNGAAQQTEQGESAATEVAPEDLPPLEYSELQAATSRRRRRRRSNGSTPGATTSAPASNAPATPAPATSATPIAPVAPFSIQSGQTLNQMNQGGEASGPFMGPEPSPARGSAMHSSIRPLRTGRNGNTLDVQRGITPTTPARPGENIISNAGVNYLASVLKDAIQTQTDRIAAELRRSNQAPTNVSFSVPAFPSTERVGVFVDVANLLYSARNLRITIDFGKLLDFLRGNRRLVRAHAYCPTSSQPGEDQMFLQAVKGLGYRITTKNYKTFASGARKADLDLDLCMDVVRLVEGKAVDSIVLVSGDSDFMPMLDYCSDHGVRVEIAAFDESMSATLRQSCDLFVNLAMLEEIRA
jgi:uncharacterized LabA/DUF88 family protein